jgi:hypothetical protein
MEPDRVGTISWLLVSTSFQAPLLRQGTKRSKPRAASGPRSGGMPAASADFAHLAMPPGTASQNEAKADRSLQKVGG